VGSEVQGICGRCGDVWHVVIAFAGDRIAQVQCGECGARHRYRPSGGAPAGEASPDGARHSRSPARRSAASARRGSAKPVVEADPSRPRRAFSPHDSYQVGDRLLHPTFGEGVVQAILGASKLLVLFDSGPKRLVQGRGRS
jgi:hypothetical protein